MKHLQFTEKVNIDFDSLSLKKVRLSQMPEKQSSAEHLSISLNDLKVKSGGCRKSEIQKAPWEVDTRSARVSTSEMECDDETESREKGGV